MPRNQKKHISWGSIAAYAFFGVYIIMIGLGATFHWRALDLAFAFLTLAAIAVGSAIVLWHGWQHRGEPRGVRLGQFAALPRSWQKWVLGERDDDAPNSSSKRTR